MRDFPSLGNRVEPPGISVARSVLGCQVERIPPSTSWQGRASSFPEIRLIRTIASVVFLTIPNLYAQPVPPPRFEVASIKPTPPELQDGHSGGHSGNGRYDMHNRTLKTYIMRAYYVGPNQISGGPSWLDSDRFDINAKSEEETDGDEVLMAMLRTLLADRCKLAIHVESKPIEAYVLEVAKNGPKLEKAKDPTASATTNSGHGTIEARVISMKRFAE